MASGSAARTVRLFRDRTLSPEALSSVLAGAARRIRDGLIESGEASRTFRTFVDGREGAIEESVRPDGAIVYRFAAIGEAAAFCLAFCMARSPRDSGAYRNAWIVAVNGRPWTADLNEIPAGAEVMVVNPMPYARKIDAGAMRMRVPPGIVEAARQAGRRAYPALDFERAFVTISASIGAPPGVEVPYILRGHAHLGRVQQSRRSSAFRKGHIFRAPRSDTAKGQELTYPALIISPRA